MPKLNPDDVIALAIEIYNKEGGKEWTFEMLDYEESHKYCIKARKQLTKKEIEALKEINKTVLHLPRYDKIGKQK